MEIEVKRLYGTIIIVKMDNVSAEIDIEEREDRKLEDGKTDFSRPPKRDISTKYLNKVNRLLDDMIEYREKEYDSSDLILRLFEKLPSDKMDRVFKDLKRNYDFSE